MKALIIRFSSAGDILIAAPVIAALKKLDKKNRVHLLAKEKFRPAAELAGADRVLALEKTGIRDLNAQNYGLILDLQNNLRSRLISLLVNSPQKRVYNKDVIKRRLMVLFKWFLGKSRRVVDKYMEALKGIVPGSEFRVPSSLRTPKSAIRNYTVVLHVGAKWPLKRWPYFAELAKLLARDRRVKVILTGSKDEVENSGEMLYIRGQGIRNEIGKTSFPELARMISRAGLFIGNDTAAAHLAKLYGVPAIVFLGPTAQEFGFINNRDFLVAERDMLCRPCHLHGGTKCPIDTHACMRGTSAGRAAGMAKKALKMQER
jgi:heptosyltransferase-2